MSITITLNRVDADIITRVLERAQDEALRGETSDMDTYLACNEVVTQIDRQTVIHVPPAPTAGATGGE